MNYVPKCTVGQLTEGQHHDVSSGGQHCDTVAPTKDTSVSLQFNYLYISSSCKNVI